ncbi:MAG TPA: phosphodiester glycosidase family protein [Acidobacteriota bacterium]|nr:phosphodiester glycosidase family protein [Acidobacteriota bacterium]
MKKFCCCIITLLLFCSCAFCQERLDLFPGKPGTLVCWTETRTVPRPLKIYYLKAGLNGSGLEAFALPGDDPDGPGPAESQLTMPEELFRKFHALAAVNANAFAGLPGDTAPAQDWFEGRAVDIHGTVVSGGKVISPIENNRTSFWLDTLQKPHIGTPASMDTVAEAVADWFSPLLIDSRIIPDPADQVLHPRTAVGFDDTGAWLLLIVVDGRQPGFSEGVSLYELAQILQGQGCTQSINLDGGGSSIMLVQEPGKDLRTINSPSGKTHRPVPVMLGIRKSERP